MRVSHRPQFVYDNIDSMRQIRLACKFSIVDVAKATGIIPTHIGEWELGYRYPAQTNYNKLAAFYDWEVWQ